MERDRNEPGLTRRWLPVALVAIGLLVAAIVPTGPSEPTMLFGVGLDKYLHAVGYGLLAGTLAGTLRRRPTPATMALVVGVTVCYGLGTELLQFPLASRSFSRQDIVADGVGAVLAVGLWSLSRRET